MEPRSLPGIGQRNLLPFPDPARVADRASAATAGMVLKQRMLSNVQMPLKEAVGRGQLKAACWRPVFRMGQALLSATRILKF
jgi:hypothetical protein